MTPPAPLAIASPANDPAPPSTAVVAPAGFDFSATAPVIIAEPPWQHTLVSAAHAPPAGPAPKLISVRAERADPVRGMDPQPFRSDQPFYIAPVDEGRLPPGAPSYPAWFAQESLRAVIPSGERTLLIYGGRYLIALRAEQLERVLDLEALRHPPRANPEWQGFAVQDATYAQVIGDSLFVCNGGGSYAREVFGKKGYVTALDLQTGALRWRSDALRCNASFAIVGDYLATGYGFTDEPDFLYLLRLSDGATVARAKLGSGPDDVTFDGTRIHVEAYSHVHDFALR